MKDKLLLKALVCSAFMCSLSMGTMAADVSTDVKAGDTDRSSWMDRTDIGIGLQGTQKDSYHDAKINPRPYTRNSNSYYRSTHSSKKEIKPIQYFIETIQPIKYYGKNDSSVLFVQGRLDSNGGEKVSTHAYWNGGGGSEHDNQVNSQNDYVDKGETVQHDSLGLVGSVGVGYRRLSKHEHAYIGANTFLDYAFKNKLSRASVGLEYVAGLNKISTNVYYGLSTKKTEPYYFNDSLIIVPRQDEFYDPNDGHPNGFTKIRYAYEHVLDGYNLRYTRDFKNARWISTYVDVYHWKTKSPGEHPTSMYYINQHKWQSINGLKLGATVNVTPHITLDLGFNKNNISSGEPYVSIMYTLGQSKYAYFGGKHSEDTLNTARSEMLDKVKRHEMAVEYYWEQNYRATPWNVL